MKKRMLLQLSKKAFAKTTYNEIFHYASLSYACLHA